MENTNKWVQLITEETAWEAKKKGFRISTNDYYLYEVGEKGTTSKCELASEGVVADHNNPFWDNTVSAPEQSVLQKWLRDKHNIHVNPQPYHETADHSSTITGYFVGEIYHTDGRMLIGVLDNYSSYEEALEAGLQKALTFIP